MNKNRKFINALLVSSMMLSGLALDVSAEGVDSVTRLGGDNRIETSTVVSGEAYGTSDSVVVAGYSGQVDAMTGTVLASAKEAPLLFVGSDAKDIKRVEDEIDRLGAETIYVVGSDKVVSEEIRTALAAKGTIVRVDGDNREETAVAVAKEVDSKTGHAFLTYNGWNGSLADALSAGPAAGHKNSPILLTKTNELPTETAEALKDLNIDKVSIIGGTEVVGEKVEAALKAMDITVEERLAGDNREATAIKIAETYFSESEKAIITNSGYADNNYADAVVGGYFGAKIKAPILLTGLSNLKENTEAYLKGNISSAYVLGKEEVVSTKGFNAIKSAVDFEEKEELTVESVSAIDEYGVTVVFENAPEEDIDDVTIEVLDNEGNVVAVKPVTVAAEETEVTFDFEKTQEDQEGVWTIGGVEWDFDLISNLEKFKDDLTQVELNKVLEDLGIENVKVKNIPTYKTEKDGFLANLEGDLTVEAIQNWVNKINNETLTEKEEDAIVKEVEEVKGNDILLLPVLEKYFERVNPDWIAKYNMSGVEEGTTTVKNIQTIINNANNGELKNEDAVKQMFTKKDLLEARELIEKYATPELDKDKNEVQSETTKKALKAIEIQLAVVDVREATTPTRLKSALTKLDEVAAKGDKFMAEKKDAEGDVTYKGYVDANAKRYFDQKSDDKTNDFKSIEGTDSAKTLLIDVNEIVDSEAVDINARLKEETRVGSRPNKVLDDKGVYTLGYAFEFHLDNYNDKDGNEISEEKLFAEVKGMEVEFFKGENSLATVTLSGDFSERTNPKISGTFDVFGDYESGSWTQKFSGDVTDIPTKAIFKVEFADSKTAIKEEILDFEDAQLHPFLTEAINRTETAEEMSNALVNLEAKMAGNEFTNLSKAAKLEVAELTLAARNELKGFEGVANTAKKFFVEKDRQRLMNAAEVMEIVNVEGYQNFLEEVNAADADIATMIGVLDNETYLSEYAELNAVAKSEKAELVLDTLKALKVEEPAKEFKTLAAIKTAAGL